MTYLFPPLPVTAVDIQGRAEKFPVRRIFCVGRNFAAHAREMGQNVRDPPFFFTKPVDALVPNGATIAFPPRTNNLHHEVELVAALGKGGTNIPVATALEHVFGYAVGNDLTRRDLQFEMRDKGRPWDIAKAFDHSAPITAIHPATQIGHPSSGRLWLKVNGELRQEGDLKDLIWSVPEIIAELSALFELAPGDLIYTGTPGGVAPLQPGDRIECSVEGLETLVTTLAPPR